MKPNNTVNSIDLSVKKIIPAAILSTSTLDATTIDSHTITAGSHSEPVLKSETEDVNNDGRLDQVVYLRTQELALTKETTQLCLAGELPDSESFTACDHIETK
mgnify:CR=1 FL=1